MTDVQAPLGVVAHDAGGAELVAHHALRLQVRCLAAIEGPAQRVFDRLGVPTTPSSLAHIVGHTSWILCGTSWQSDLEWRAMQLARAGGRRVVAVLDHWTEYADRFKRGGERVRPDEVWVTDDVARDLAVAALPGVPITVVGNPYLDEIAVSAQRRGVRPTEREQARNVLLVPEPTSAHAQARYGDPLHFGYTEIDAIRFFVQHARAAFPALERVRVRPHPADPAGKYEELMSGAPWPVEIDNSRSLLDDLLGAEGVVGCNTVAMVAALRAGRPVVCCIPPAGPGCLLPHKEIVMLRELVA